MWVGEGVRDECEQEDMNVVGGVRMSELEG